MGQVLVSDDIDKTVAAIHGFLEQGAGLIAVTGGMSVDPDDQTPAAIRAAGGKVVTYGAPTFPGAMFMLAYIDGVEPAVQCSLRGLHGSLLVEQGRTGLGLPLLYQVLPQFEDAASRAWVLCYMALGEATEGHLNEAADCLAQARALKPDCLVLARAERDLARRLELRKHGPEAITNSPAGPFLG